MTMARDLYCQISPDIGMPGPVLRMPSPPSLTGCPVFSAAMAVIALKCGRRQDYERKCPGLGKQYR